MAKPVFSKLWNDYPKEQHPCDSKRGPEGKGYSYQCAIRMSVALNNEGSISVNETTYSGNKCPHGHARGAQGLANWLETNHLRTPTFRGKAKIVKKKIKSSNGIIFFKDCFAREGEKVRRGDHIDLWKAGTTKGFNDPHNNSAEVWFWKLP